MRVQILAPWPLRVPRHGGQLRGAAVAQAYRNAGHDVRTISIYDVNHAKPDEVWPDDFIPTQDALDLLPSHDSANSEMALWRALAAAPRSFGHMVATLRSFQPDLLQFEEPVFWPIVQRLQAEGHLKGIAIAHSSYNFETHAWRLRGLLGAPLNEQTLRDISTFEREIAAHCDVIFAVSEDDAHEFRSLGAKFVHVAENGVASLGCRARHPIDAYLPSRTSYALFVSSAHPPNAHGFIEMAARAHGHPLRDGELLICGRVGPMIQGAPRFLHTGRIFHRSRVLGWVDAEMLDALYAGTRVVILPKTHGGGSNLKTAEALASGRPIVATRQAFIGFERFMELPDIFVSDEPDTFWRRVNEHLAAPLVVENRSPEAMSGLLWSESLKSMVRAGEDAVLRVQQKRLTHVD